MGFYGSNDQVPYLPNKAKTSQLHFMPVYIQQNSYLNFVSHLQVVVQICTYTRM